MVLGRYGLRRTRLLVVGLHGWWLPWVFLISHCHHWQRNHHPLTYLLTVTGALPEKAIEEEKVVDDLLAKTQERSENYVLGLKSQATQARPETPILDQGLIDSLLANDAYNFLVRRALGAGLAVKRVQADKAHLLERRKNLEDFLKSGGSDQATIIA